MNIFKKIGEIIVPPPKPLEEINPDKPRPVSPYRDASLGEREILPKDHYFVEMTDKPFPTMEELKKEFGEENVTRIFDECPWTNHPSCEGFAEKFGEKVFWLASFPIGKRLTSEEFIAWAGKQRSTFAPNGYRPATHKELYAFQNAYSYIKFPEYLIALGSYKMYRGYRGGPAVALLCSGFGSGRGFIGSDINGRMRAIYRYLLVRK